MFPPAPSASFPQTGGAPAPYAVPLPPQPFLAQSPSDAPSPVGLVLAAAGLLLLCVSFLLPRISITYDGEADFGYFGLTSLSGGQTFAIDTSSVVLTTALLFAVGLSAHRSPGLRWPARLSAVGLAALTAAFAYHPITVMRQFLQSMEDSEDGFGESTPEVTVEADNGLYLAVIAVALLAASAFMMRLQRRPQVHYHQAPPPAAGPGTAPGVTVTPG